MTDLQEFLSKLHENLIILREREAKFSTNASLDLINQIHDYETAIVLTQTAIKEEISKAELLERLKSLAISEVLVQSLEKRTVKDKQKLEIIDKLNSLLVQNQQNFASLISLIGPQEKQVKVETLEIARKSKEEFYNYFDEHRIYLDKDLCIQIEGFYQILESAWNDYYLSQVYDHTVDFEAAARMNRGFNTVTEKIPKLRQEIELEFHRLVMR
jgi:AbiV family abortive infection protein